MLDNDAESLFIVFIVGEIAPMPKRWPTKLSYDLVTFPISGY